MKRESAGRSAAYRAFHLLAATALGTATLAAASGTAAAGTVQEPGEASGFNVYAPLPDGLYIANVGSYGVRSPVKGHGPETGELVDIPVFLISTPLTVLGGKFELLLAQPFVDVSVSHTTGLFGAYYSFAQPILAWDLGYIMPGLSAGLGLGVYWPTFHSEIIKAVFGDVETLRPDAGLYYSANNITLGATFSYNAVLNSDNHIPHNDALLVDLTALYDFGKIGTGDLSAGVVGYGFIDTTHASVRDAYHPQGVVAVGPMVQYVVGGVVLQARLTREVAEQHLGGFETRFWTGLAVPLGNPFGEAPPPPTPAVVPAPPPARSYLVFFDWDKATLTERARSIIHEAADAANSGHFTSIRVNGYTDTSGTPQYNQGLSVRRAEAVAAELVRDGVPREEITIRGFGETHLLVPTGPGVREPQNRRVEIIF